MSRPILGHWQYTGEAFDVNDYFGFIYLITNNVSGKKYLGRKFFWVHQKRKRVRESNWRVYTGSCKPLTADIKALGKPMFTFEILSLYKTRGGLGYFETYHLCALNTLTERDINGVRTWYNGNVGAVRWIPAVEPQESEKFISDPSVVIKVPTVKSYKFVHKDGTQAELSPEALVKGYKLTLTSVLKLVAGSQKTHKGWTISI
jgi:hypothetical protein